MCSAAPVVLEEEKAVVEAVQANLGAHVADGDALVGQQRLRVANGHDEGAQAVVDAPNVELRKDDGVRRRLAQVARPHLRRLDVGRVEEEGGGGRVKVRPGAHRLGVGAVGQLGEGEATERLKVEQVVEDGEVARAAGAAQTDGDELVGEKLLRREGPVVEAEGVVERLRQQRVAHELLVGQEVVLHEALQALEGDLAFRLAAQLFVGSVGEDGVALERAKDAILEADHLFAVDHQLEGAPVEGGDATGVGEGAVLGQAGHQVLEDGLRVQLRLDAAPGDAVDQAVHQ